MVGDGVAAMLQSGSQKLGAKAQKHRQKLGSASTGSSSTPESGDEAESDSDSDDTSPE